MENKSEEKKKRKKGCFGCFGLILFIALVGSCVGALDSEGDSAETSQEVAKNEKSEDLESKKNGSDNEKKKKYDQLDVAYAFTSGMTIEEYQKERDNMGLKVEKKADLGRGITGEVIKVEDGYAVVEIEGKEIRTTNINYETINEVDDYIKDQIEMEIWLEESNKAMEEAEKQAEKDAAELEKTLEEAKKTVYYENCDAVRAAGAAPIQAGEPGYDSHLDRDGDGIGCDR